MSVIAVFPLKTGGSMFVGFDSQNTSHSFPDYLNWNLWVPGIPIIRLRGGSLEEIGLSNDNSSLVLIPYYLKNNYFPLDFLGGVETTTFEDLDPAGPLGVGNTV